MAQVEMYKRKRLVFVPATDYFWIQYEGYIYNQETRPDLTDQKIHKKRIKRKLTHESRWPQVLHIIIIIPVLLMMLPFLLLVKLISIGKFEVFEFIEDTNSFYFKLVPWQVESFEFENVKEKYKNAVEESFIDFYASVKKRRFKLVLYGTAPIDSERQALLDRLTSEGKVDYWFPEWNKAFEQFVKEDTDFKNALFITDNKNNIDKLEEQGFPNEKGINYRKIIHWNPYVDQKVVNDRNSGIVNVLKDVFFRSYATNYPQGIQNATLDCSTVYYIGTKGDEQMRSYIHEHYSDIVTGFSNQGYKFVFLDQEVNAFNTEISENLLIWLHSFFPSLRQVNENDLHKALTYIFLSKEKYEIENYLLRSLEVPVYDYPILLRKLSDHDNFQHDEYTFLPLNLIPPENLAVKLNDYFNQLNLSSRGAPAYSKVNLHKGFWDADRYFYELITPIYPSDDNDPHAEELNAISEQLDRINNNKHAPTVAGLMELLAEKLKADYPEVANDILVLLKKHLAAPRLSRIVIDPDYKISLPDYKIADIPMYPLAKILFLLFLDHPEGILFKNLTDHRKQLFFLYTAVTGREPTIAVRQSIEDLIDSTNPSVNQKAARIRASFRTFLPEEIAKYYYITGENAEPKKIVIPREKVKLFPPLKK